MYSCDRLCSAICQSNSATQNSTVWCRSTDQSDVRECGTCGPIRVCRTAVGAWSGLLSRLLHTSSPPTANAASSLPLSALSSPDKLTLAQDDRTRQGKGATRRPASVCSQVFCSGTSLTRCFRPGIRQEGCIQVQQGRPAVPCRTNLALLAQGQVCQPYRCRRTSVPGCRAGVSGR